ncbi:MAG: META domain-containing protein [Nitriliruptoraceae bacterium]
MTHLPGGSHGPHQTDGPDRTDAALVGTDRTDAALVGTSWQLRELISGGGLDAAVGGNAAEAELVFREDGRLVGSTGCNRLTGDYELDGDLLVLGAVATTRMACLDDRVAQQEQRVLAVLQAGTLEVELEGTRLVLRAGDGLALGYRAR